MRSAIAPVQSVGRLGPAGADAGEQRRHAGADVADHRRGDRHVAVDLGRRDVDLDELLPPAPWRVAAPGLALAVRQQPVQARADQHHHVGFGQHVRTRGRCRLRMVVGQQALGHGHRQVGDAGLLDQARMSASACAYAAPLPSRISGRLAPLSRSSARCTASGAGIWRGAGSTTLISDLLARLGVHRLREQLGRQVEVDAARPARQRRADGARDADADVLGVQHAEGRLAQRLGDGELVHLLVVALLQVDDLALAGAADQDHREAVGRRVGQRRQAVQEAGRRHRQADAGFLRQEAGGGGGVAGVLLVAERDDPHALGLRHAGQVGDRDAGQGEDRVDVVELQCIDEEVETVGRCVVACGVRFGCCHGGSVSRTRSLRNVEVS